MKRMWLVGESLPLRADGTQRKAQETLRLPATLVPLDPRHGVFPNLVMTPLFAAGHSLSKSCATQLRQFFEEVQEVLADEPTRRFNLFEDRVTKSKKKGKEETCEHHEEESEELASDVFRINDASMAKRLESFDLQNDIWLVFGHQTNKGLFWWLLDRKSACDTTRERIRKFSDGLAEAVTECLNEMDCGETSQLSGRIGLLHQLCAGANHEGVLEKVVLRLNSRPSFPTEKIVRWLRATVPLLHNEAYQDGSNPIGNSQAHFVRQARGKTDNGDLYWQVIGNAIATRFLDDYVS